MFPLATDEALHLSCQVGILLSRLDGFWVLWRKTWLLLPFDYHLFIFDIAWFCTCKLFPTDACVVYLRRLANLNLVDVDVDHLLWRLVSSLRWLLHEGLSS